MTPLTFYHISHQKQTPHTVKKDGKSWDVCITQLIIEMLANRTQPTCVTPNILSTVEILFPNSTIIHELPSLRFVRSCRSIVVHVTKTLAAYLIAKAKKFDEIFSDGTSRHQTAIQNLIVRFLTESGFKTITLSTSIIAEEETSESLAASIMQTFKESGSLLEKWRDTTLAKFPDKLDLIAIIPKASGLTVTKLANQGMIMMDTCNSTPFLQNMIQHIKDHGSKDGLSPDDVRIYEGDCWHHLRNIWFGRVTTQFSKTLANLLQDDLAKVPAILCISTEINDLLQCVEKEFGFNANYAKGHGSMFEKWMHTYHPTSYLFHISLACGGARQDLGVEGAPALLMNVPYYTQFLNWGLSIGINSDCILQRKFFTMFWSMEKIALLCLLSILHISICLTTRWLAGNAKDLAEYDFGYYDMGKVLDKMEDFFKR